MSKSCIGCESCAFRLMSLHGLLGKNPVNELVQTFSWEGYLLHQKYRRYVLSEARMFSGDPQYWSRGWLRIKRDVVGFSGSSGRCQKDSNFRPYFRGRCKRTKRAEISPCMRSTRQRSMERYEHTRISHFHFYFVD